MSVRITEREAARLLHKLLTKPAAKSKRKRATATTAPRPQSAGEAAYSAALARYGADLGALVGEGVRR